MAKFTPGPAVAQISGSVGGVTFSVGRYGMYMRRRAIPINPGTSYQETQKNAFAIASRHFKTLNSLQLAAWKTYALENPVTDNLGQRQTLSANAVCMQINTRMVLMGQSLLNIPPLADPPDALETIVQDGDIGAGNCDVTFTPTPMPANTWLFLYSAVVDSAGINYVKNRLRLVFMCPAAQASPFDAEPYLMLRFGTLQVGQKIVTIGRAVSQVTGLISAPLRAADVIVTST